MKYSHILWDFNGTLLDDVGIGMDAINVLLRSRNLPELTDRNTYQQHFRFPIEDYYRSVGFDFEKDPYDILAHAWVKEYRAREHTAPLYAGAREILSRIQKKEIPQILFSATQRQMLEEQVKALGIQDYFDEILGSDNIYAEGKTAIGVRWAEKTVPARALMIGDTLHDKMAADAMGIECVLITQGHQSRERLKEAGCPLLETLRDLEEFLEL